MPENFPAHWLEQLRSAGIDTGQVTKLTGFQPEASEWFFYHVDGSRHDLLFTSPAEVAAAGVTLPSGFDEPMRLEPAELARLEAAVQAASSGAAEPQPAPSARTRAEDLAERLCVAQAVHLSPNSYARHLSLAQYLSQAGRLVSLDPGHYIKGLPLERLAELLQWVTIFAPSEREVYEFRGPCDVAQAAVDFAEMGPTIVVIKVGPRGSLVYDRSSGRLRHIPAFPARTLDPTGCGDSYCGGFLAGYAESGDVMNAALCGTVAASFTVEGFGATYSLRFTRMDAERRHAELQTRIGTDI
jgi:ribokinase